MQSKKMLVGQTTQEGTMDKKIYINGELFVKFEIIKKYITPDQLAPAQAEIAGNAEHLRSTQQKALHIVSVRRKKRYLSSYVGKHGCR